MNHHVAGDGHDWPPEVWAWSPSLGRWSPKYGTPKQPVHFKVTTDIVAPEHAYDYWRDIAFYYFEADLPRCQRREFRASSNVVSTPVGNIYAYWSRAVLGQRSQSDIRKDEGHTFDLGMVLRGRRSHRDETDTVYVAGPGDVFCYDAAKASRIEWTDHEGIHLTLPRALVTASIGDIPPAAEVVRALTTSNLCARHV